VTLRTSWAVQDAIDQEDARVHMAAALTPGLRATSPYGDMPIARAGFRPGYGGSQPGRVTMTGDQTCTVQPFQLTLPSKRGAVNGGAYIVTSDAVETVTDLLATPAHATYPRIDRLIVQQRDTYYLDPGSPAEITLVVGTPSATPVTPSPPPGCDWFELARWQIPPGTTNLRTVTVNRLATGEQGGDRYTVAAGGVLPVPNDASRDLLTAKGWAGLTVYNSKDGTAPGALEVLSGPGGTWTRQGTGSQILKMGGDYTPGVQPVKVDSTLYLFGNDLYLWRAPGVWTRLTYNDIDAEWYPADIGACWPDEWPVSRKTGPHLIQMHGLVSADDGRTRDFSNDTLLCRLTSGHRPLKTQYANVVTGFGNDYATTAKIMVVGSDNATGNRLPGQIILYRPTAHLIRWVSLDGVFFYLDSGNP
jgi:hypothetical protein